jgi:hypothetical protein
MHIFALQSSPDQCALRTAGIGSHSRAIFV